MLINMKTTKEQQGQILDLLEKKDYSPKRLHEIEETLNITRTSGNIYPDDWCMRLETDEASKVIWYLSTGETARPTTSFDKSSTVESMLRTAIFKKYHIQIVDEQTIHLCQMVDKPVFMYIMKSLSQYGFRYQGYDKTKRAAVWKREAGKR